MRLSRRLLVKGLPLTCVLGLLLISSLQGAEPTPFNVGRWPFRPPVRPPVPAVQDGAAAINPIDAFILQRLEATGLTFTPAADKLALLRRVTFDLTGLPPTLAEQQAFLADTADDAYARLVERLLESPRYGERWAQHWLDVVRYAETEGFKDDTHRPNAHKYRDYVIRAFNADLPYDRFIRQQLAGDELEPNNPEAIVATGLNRLYPDESNAADLRQRRQEIHDELTDTTALAFLGLTVGCAQCHDHKFDPITQVDYFRLQAFFAPLLPRDDMTTAAPEEQQQFAERSAAWQAATQTIRTEIESLLAPKREATFVDAMQKFDAEIRAAVDKPRDMRTCLDEQIAYQAMKFVAPKMAGVSAKNLSKENQQRVETLQKELAAFDELKPKPLPMAMAVSDAGLEPPATHRLALGNYRKPLEEVRPGFPAFLGASEPEIQQPAGVQSTGRRAALANWLCRPDHPLTARVMVNRLWQHHFGVGIVATPNDFGATGEAPTHADLLDWLAVEFIEQGWSLKAMHRLMVTSAAYRQASRGPTSDQRHKIANASDSGNRLLWQGRRQRLEGEAIRDAMLQLAGGLQTEMFGPSARPELPRDLEGQGTWKADKQLERQNRRSIYVLAKRNLRYPLLDIFDLPDLHNSCPLRSATTTAPQALALLNGEFSMQQAERWSSRLLAEHGNQWQTLLQAAYTEAFARPATLAELAAAQQFILQQSATVAAENMNDDNKVSDKKAETLPANVSRAQAAALVDFCHALLNANEFLYVD